jgi:hypothetical protein
VTLPFCDDDGASTNAHSPTTAPRPITTGPWSALMVRNIIFYEKKKSVHHTSHDQKSSNHPGRTAPIPARAGADHRACADHSTRRDRNDAADNRAGPHAGPGAELDPRVLPGACSAGIIIIIIIIAATPDSSIAATRAPVAAVARRVAAAIAAGIAHIVGVILLWLFFQVFLFFVSRPDDVRFFLRDLFGFFFPALGWERGVRTQYAAHRIAPAANDGAGGDAGAVCEHRAAPDDRERADGAAANLNFLKTVCSLGSHTPDSQVGRSL